MTVAHRRAALLLAVVVGIAYANHFGNTFHFDDSHAIIDNPSVRSLTHLGRFFVDATTFSILPENQSYRPVLSATLALDYWIGDGYVPAVFHTTSFTWFAIQLVLMYLLFEHVMAKAGTASPAWVALAATAMFALHPAMAETVNYVIQRGEILATAGVLASLVLYARRPASRRYALYLIPAVIGALAKPIAMVFPVLLLAYVWLFEREKWRDVLPAAGTFVVVALWMWSRTPPTFSTGGGAPELYWLTQGWVALRYVGTFVAPLWLNADHDSALLTGFGDTRAAVGVAFVIGIAWLAVRVRRHKTVAFGLWWFLIALAPTSLTPLAEVSNDHRLFFPFVGLALAAASGVALCWERLPQGLRRPALAAALMVVVIGAGAVGVHARNRVWRTSESLWHDVTVKSPDNGRGHMNYGVALMARGDFPGALAAFERARTLVPDYPLLHVNFGIVSGAMGQDRQADAAFRRAIALAPDDWRGRMFYGRWLTDVDRFREAVAELTRASSANPRDPEPRRLLDRALGRWRDAYVARSLGEYRRGEFRECLRTVQQGLALRQESAELHNNASACHNSLGEWDSGIAAAREALRLAPGLAIAANNLAFAEAQKGVK